MQGNMKKGLKLDGKKVQLLRQQNNWTQTELGGRIMKENKLNELSLRTVQRIEKDPEYLCSKTTVQQLAKVFKVKVEELIYKSEKINNKGVVTEFDKKETNFGLLELISETKKQIKEEWKHDFNPEEIFCLNEYQIRYIEDTLIGDPISGWMSEESAWRVSEVLRKKYKFVDTRYKTFMEEDLINERMFEIFSKSFHLDLFDIVKCNGKLINRLYGLEDFLSNLDKANRYVFDYDIPRDEKTLEIVSQFVDGIEKYLYDGNPNRLETKSGDLVKAKFAVSELIKTLGYPENRMSIFWDQWQWAYQEFDNKIFGYRWREASVVRICIKNWENPDVLSLDQCCVKESKEIITREIEPNPAEYIDPPASDGNEPEQNITDEQQKDDIPF